MPLLIDSAELAGIAAEGALYGMLQGLSTSFPTTGANHAPLQASSLACSLCAVMTSSGAAPGTKLNSAGQW